MAKTQTQELSQAVELYLDLMYDCEVGKFDRAFSPSARLHGFRDGKMTCWAAAHYKEILAGRKSPVAGSRREEQVLLLEMASPTQALAKVRIRINDMVFVDYLSYHKIDGRWQGELAASALIALARHGALC